MSNHSLRPDILALLGALVGLSGGAADGAAGATQSAPAPPDAAPAAAALKPAIACTLGSAEKRERSAAIRRDLLPRVRSVSELPDGWVLWFDRAEGELARIASFVELESQCCAFFDFEIRLDSGGDRIALVLAGPAGAKEVLRPLIESRQPAD